MINSILNINHTNHCMRFKILFLSAVMLYFSSCSTSNIMVQELPVDYVDPFIGTDLHGHTFPGATMPNGMVQVSQTQEHLVGMPALDIIIQIPQY